MIDLQRNDTGMPELLRFDNIAWYEDGIVRILDRRVYPMEKRFEICYTAEDVASAIKNMVTQSGGPLLAVQMGMALAAKKAKESRSADRIGLLEAASVSLGTARPTTSAELQRLANKSLEQAKTALANDTCPVEAVFINAIIEANRRYAIIEKQAKHLVATFAKKATVMTQCFAETMVGKMCLEIKATGKKIRFICPETRPYLQGARLTASVITDLGLPVYVITDNMPAAIMKREGVDVFTSAADVITGDYHVINKVGTFQIALAANYFGIPFYVNGKPSTEHKTPDTVKIEERNTDDVLEWFGKRTTKSSVKAFYPAFDVTPPQLVTGIVTEHGIVQPNDYSKD